MERNGNRMHEWIDELKDQSLVDNQEHKVNVLTNLLAGIMEQFPSCFFVLDNQYDIIATNTGNPVKLSELFGKPAEEAGNFLELVPLNQRHLWKERLSKAFEQEQEIQEKVFIPDSESLLYQFSLRSFHVYGRVAGLILRVEEITPQRRSMDLLKERRETFKALTENLKVAVYTYNDKGYFTYVNPSIERITGYSEEELRKMCYHDLVHPDYREMVKKRGIARLMGNDVPRSYELKILTREGQERWLEVSNSRINLKNTTMVLGTATDITERKKAEEDLKVERAYLENLFENSPEAIVVTSNDGKIERINKEFTRLFGYVPEEARGRSIDDLIAPAGMKNKAARRTRDVAGGDWISAETQRVDKYGNYIHVSILGAPIEVEGKQRAVYGIYRDISERVRAQQDLKESNAQLQYVLDNSKDVIFQVDLDGYFIFINQAAEEMTGYPLHQLLKMNFSDVLAPGYYEHFNEWLQKYDKERITGDTLKLKLLPRDLHSKWIEVSTTPVYRNEEMVRLQGVAREITERVKYEQELKKAKEKAEEADRLKSAFLANMSHEIRTPMNAILGFSNMLKDPSLSQEEREEYTSIINSRGGHLLQIISDIIDLSKIEAGQLVLKKTTFNLNGFMDDTYAAFSKEIQDEGKKHIHLYLEKDLEDDNAYIQTDKTRLYQVLTNLLSNALKYTREGFIQFGYRLVRESRGYSLKFFVKDTGIGVDDSKKEVVFGYFRQSDDSKTREYGGAGLGLSISKRLVELLEGKIWLESEKEKGSVFYFTLPLVREQEAEGNSEQYAKKNNPMNWKDKRILIVEDDQLSIRFLTTVLKDSQADLLYAKSGKEAVNKVREHQDLDLILMDVQLPGMSGNEAASRIRQFNDKIPIIAQTAHAMSEDRMKSIDAGCDDYITKPIDISLLLNKISEYI